MTISEKNVANYALLQCKTFSLKIWLCKMFDKYHVWSGLCATQLYHRSDNSSFSRVRVGQIRPISIANPNPFSLCITLLYHTHRWSIYTLSHRTVVFIPWDNSSISLEMTIIFIPWDIPEVQIRKETEIGRRGDRKGLAHSSSAQSVHHLKLESWKWVKKIVFISKQLQSRYILSLEYAGRTCMSSLSWSPQC